VLKHFEGKVVGFPEVAWVAGEGKLKTVFLTLAPPDTRGWWTATLPL